MLYKIVRPALEILEKGIRIRIGELTRHWRYTIEDRRGLQRIMALFNGNLILPKRRRQFANWVKEAALIHHSSFALKQQEETSGGPVISLNTGWLSGLIDAEGCFYAHVTTRRGSKMFLPFKRCTSLRGTSVVTKRFCPDWAAVAKQRKGALGKTPDCYRIEVSSLESHKILVDYLKRFPLHQKAFIR